MKKLLIPAFFCTLSLPAFAQQPQTAGDILGLVSPLSHDQCLEASRRFSANIGSAQDLASYDLRLAEFISTGIDLFCEASRYTDVEIPRLQGERERLIRVAQETEEKWQSDHQLNPIRFSDFPGRDASQQRNLADAERISSTIADHERESRRLQDLGLASIEIALNADPTAAADLLRRLLGELPIPTA